ncbi:Transcriptional regulator, MarR family [Lachnospiraceae bacterium TWA4]|nr:Transcriptional regulator, MarR family [Lachnospiraceae bacterium TWA4]
MYHEAALKLGMSDSELDIFYIIATYGNGCNQSLLYKETGMRKSTVNTSIHKLEKEEVIYLKAGEGRNKKVYVTSKGMDYLHRVEKIIEIENKIYCSWSEEERQLFIKLNERYATQLEEEIKNL